MKNVFIIVPTLDPDEKIMKTFIDELKGEFSNILIVNDGSDSKHDSFFKKFEKEGIIVLKHYKNYGKGRAIKNAFNYILNNYPDIKGVITCDSDGQHGVKDIKKCAKEMINNPDKLVIGSRNFDDDKVPARSKFGNKVTRSIFSTFVGLEITDTQTGLRGFSKDLMIKFSDCMGERYEYETNMLIICKKEDIKIKEVEIETIYINNNETSHFNPIKDSIRIYKLFSNYFLLSFSTYLIDILLFCYFLNIININSKILAATILARLVSSVFTFLFNYQAKFKNIKLKTLTRYYILVLVQMFMSGCFTTFFFGLIGGGVVIIKMLVDLVIWVVNLFIQKDIVFVGENNE